MALKYKRVLLKLSGEALAGEKHFGLDYPTVASICKSIKGCVDLGAEVAILVGGGNFWRGRANGGMDRTRADHIGMLATAMNALSLADALEALIAAIYIDSKGINACRTVVLGLMNADYYKWSNGKFSNGVNKMTTDVITQISQWVSDGLIKDPRESNLLNNFIKGKCGIAITNAYGMKATGYFDEMNPNDVGFTYIPKYNDSSKSYTTGLFRGWGLIRGAKHPVEAGLFLRYYLDVNNYDVNSAFISADAQSFFFKLTSGINTDQKNPYMLLGITELRSEKVSDYTGISGMAPAQVSTQISSISPKIDSNAKKVNEEI